MVRAKRIQVLIIVSCVRTLEAENVRNFYAGSLRSQTQYQACLEGGGGGGGEGAEREGGQEAAEREERLFVPFPPFHSDKPDLCYVAAFRHRENM